MNSGEMIQVIGKGYRALRSPRAAAQIVRRRLFPFGIQPVDREAYRIGSWKYGQAGRCQLVDVFPGIEPTDLQIFRSFDRQKDLSLDSQELLSLCAIVAHCQPKSLIEIGTSDGNTTMNLVANAHETARVVTVDLPPNWSGEFGIKVAPIMRNITELGLVGKQFRDSKFESQILQLLIDSAELDLSGFGQIDFAFIDGCHDYSYVMSDTEICTKAMKSGSVIVWHDYGMIEDVSKAVDDWAELNQLEVKVVEATRLAVAQIP